MKKALIITAAVAGTLLLGGCDKANNQTASSTPAPAAPEPAVAQTAPTPPPPPPVEEAAPAPAPITVGGDTSAVVNGKPISKLQVDARIAEVQQRQGANGVPEEKIIDELVSRELLRQEAEQQHLTKDPANAARVENALRMALSQMDAENYVKNAAVSDEEVKKEYETRINAMKLTEYKASHILVDSEASAKDILAKLAKGEKFDALAKKLSKDPGSKVNGGDLGWFNPQQMVPEFSQAVAALKNGETTQTPVKTQFGFHIIRRDDSRDQAPPPFDDVKNQIRSMLQTQKLQQHIAELNASAKIERAAPPAKPEAPTAAPAAPQAEPVKPATPAEAAAEKQPAAQPVQEAPKQPAQ